VVAEPRIAPPVPLSEAHRTEGFSCGVPALDQYLIRWACADQRAEKSRTYVAVAGGTVVAFYSLAAGAVVPADAPQRVTHGQGAQPIPVIVLARLAVDSSHQRAWLGEALLLDALARCASAADVIGARAVFVHAASAAARGFYLRYGFEVSPASPLHLMLLMKDVGATLRPR
jgi:GNAT superfamily N-acetyltransferase